MKRLKQYSFWEYMRVLLVFIAGLAVSLLVFSYNVQVRTEQNVEELLDYNTDHQQSQLKFMLNTQFIYLGNIADYVAKEDSLMCEKNQELLSCMTQDTLFHAISVRWMENEESCYQSRSKRMVRLLVLWQVLLIW